MVYGLLAVVVGAVYGYFKQGRQDKLDILKTGVVWGVVLAAVLAFIGFLMDASVVGLGADFVGLALSFVVMVGLFVLGVLVGDWFEERTAAT